MLTALFSSRLCGAAYNVVDHARPRTADDLSVTTAVSPLSPVPISRCRRSTLPTIRPFEIVCARARVGCFAAIVVLLYWSGSQPQQTFIDELTPVR